MTIIDRAISLLFLTKKPKISLKVWDKVWEEQYGLEDTGARMVGTGVMGLPGSMRAGTLVNQTDMTRIAFRCSIRMITDGMIVNADGFFHSFVK